MRWPERYDIAFGRQFISMLMPLSYRAWPPLRVAVVSSSLKLAGAEKQTVYLTRALRDAGSDVRFFYLGEGGYYERVLRQMGISLLQIYKRNRPLQILARLSQALLRFKPEIVFSP